MALFTSTTVVSKIVNSAATRRFFVTSSRVQLATSARRLNSSSEEECGRSKAVDKKAKILKEKTPQGKLDKDQQREGGVKHPYQEQEPLPEHPGGVNPKTGEVGGPKGPEPTRYGDWERKGRVTDF